MNRPTRTLPETMEWRRCHRCLQWFAEKKDKYRTACFTCTYNYGVRHWEDEHLEPLQVKHTDKQLRQVADKVSQLKGGLNHLENQLNKHIDASRKKVPQTKGILD